MDGTVYLNGAYIPRNEAKLDIEDRGALFGDGVYEVVHYFGGKSFAMRSHVDRLARSLEAVGIKDRTPFDEVSDELVRRNSLRDAKIYWQVSRGAAKRDHVYPENITPTILAIASAMPPLPVNHPAASQKALLLPDHRWDQCWIKSLMLLPNVMAKVQAKRNGADEAILYRGDVITEGASTNAFIVRGGEVWTHPANQFILGGITRDHVLQLARKVGVTCHEQAATVKQLQDADEVFITGTTTLIAGIVRIDDQPVGDGKVGPVTAKLHRALIDHVAQACGLDASA